MRNLTVKIIVMLNLVFFSALVLFGCYPQLDEESIITNNTNNTESENEDETDFNKGSFYIDDGIIINNHQKSSNNMLELGNIYEINLNVRDKQFYNGIVELVDSNNNKKSTITNNISSSIISWEIPNNIRNVGEYRFKVISPSLETKYSNTFTIARKFTNYNEIAGTIYNDKGMKLSENTIGTTFDKTTFSNFEVVREEINSENNSKIMAYDINKNNKLLINIESTLPDNNAQFIGETEIIYSNQKSDISLTGAFSYTNGQDKTLIPFSANDIMNPFDMEADTKNLSAFTFRKDNNVEYLIDINDNIKTHLHEHLHLIIQDAGTVVGIVGIAVGVVLWWLSQDDDMDDRTNWQEIRNGTDPFHVDHDDGTEAGDDDFGFNGSAGGGYELTAAGSLFWFLNQGGLGNMFGLPEHLKSKILQIMQETTLILEQRPELDYLSWAVIKSDYRYLADKTNDVMKELYTSSQQINWILEGNIILESR